MARFRSCMTSHLSQVLVPGVAADTGDCEFSISSRQGGRYHSPNRPLRRESGQHRRNRRIDTFYLNRPELPGKLPIRTSPTAELPPCALVAPSSLTFLAHRARSRCDLGSAGDAVGLLPDPPEAPTQHRPRTVDDDRRLPLERAAPDPTLTAVQPPDFADDCMPTQLQQDLAVGVPHAGCQ